MRIENRRRFLPRHLTSHVFVAVVLWCGTAGCRDEPPPPPPPEIPGVTGTVVHHPDFASEFVDARNIDVWLPPGYADSEARYAVLYMHDGQNLFDPAESNIGVDWGVDEAMTALIDSQLVWPVIVVGIWSTPMRVAEYLPWSMAKSLPERDLGALRSEYGSPEVSDLYLRFIVEELKPFVDQEYQTLPQQESTFVMGSSMGGLISLYAVTEYPDVFAGAGCVSTHWPIVGSSVLKYLDQHLPDPGHHKFYFDYGTETLDAEYEPYQLRVDEMLRTKGFTPGSGWMTRKFEGADHSERAWRTRVRVPLTWLFGRGR